MNRIGIVGAGAIAQAFARQALRIGCEVRLSNSRGPATLVDVVRDLGPGVSAVPAAEAAAEEIVVLAFPWTRLSTALAGLPPWNGRIAIDTLNPIGPPDFREADLGGRTSSEIIAELCPGARLVKTANTLPPELIAADPHVGEGRRVLFLSGDDGGANKIVHDLLAKMGFAVIELGGLVEGGRMQQFPDGPLSAKNLIRLKGG